MPPGLTLSASFRRNNRGSASDICRTSGPLPCKVAEGILPMDTSKKLSASAPFQSPPRRYCCSDRAVPRSSADHFVDLHAVNLAFLPPCCLAASMKLPAAGRLQDIALLKAHLRKRLIHGLDDKPERYKAVRELALAAAPRPHPIEFQLQIFAVALVKAVPPGRPKPTYRDKISLFLWGGQTVLGLNLFQECG